MLIYLFIYWQSLGLWVELKYHGSSTSPSVAVAPVCHTECDCHMVSSDLCRLSLGEVWGFQQNNMSRLVLKAFFVEVGMQPRMLIKIS